MRVYVASSWRNDWQPDIVRRLRQDHHSVYDFRNPEPGNTGFAWSSIDPDWQQWTWEQYREALRHPVAAEGFRLDMEALTGADATVLVMPCGRSAHLELGYAVGAGQHTAIILGDEQEPELMYLMADLVTGSPEQVCTFLRKREGVTKAVA